LTPALAGGAVVAGVSVFVALANLKEPPPQVAPVVRVFRVPVFVVARQDVRRVVNSFGTAQAEQEAAIAAEVAGQIVDAGLLDVGVTVRRDAEPPLVRIDPQTYAQRVKQAEALLAQDAAELAKLDQDVKNSRRLLDQKQQSLATAQAQLDQQKRLLKDGASRESDLRRVEMEFQQVEAAALQLRSDLDLEDVRRQQLEARQEAHRRDLELAQLDVQRANVHAPFDGIVSRVHVETGQYVRPGDPLFMLTDINRVEIPLPLPVGQSGPVAELLQSGVQPRVQLAEHEAAECRWVGRVTRIAPVANELTRTVDVFAEVDNRQARDVLRPGTFVHARIEGDVVPQVLLVPRAAIIEDAVFVARPQSAEGAAGAKTAVAERRPVTIDRTLHGFAVISAGLEPGDRVVLTNLDVLTDGSQLTLIEERTVRSELDRETFPGFELPEAAAVSGTESSAAAPVLPAATGGPPSSEENRASSQPVRAGS
jgi:RND family efflux transporter MFP subunit